MLVDELDLGFEADRAQTEAGVNGVWSALATMMVGNSPPQFHQLDQRRRRRHPAANAESDEFGHIEPTAP